MTIKDIEKAALEYWKREVPGGRISISNLADFAIQQVNLALEEAANSVPVRFEEEIRSLKIKD